MAGGRNRRDEDPAAPGWYPDPWSATGDGERYFDGTRWGTSERPMGRHTVAVQEPDAPSSGRGRKLAAVGLLVVLVAVAWGISRLRDSGSGSQTATATRGHDAPPPSSEESSRPLGTPAPVPDGTGRFEVLDHQRGEPATPVAWDPCRPVHYVVNVNGAPGDGLAIVQAAIAQVSRATGLRFIYDGAVTEAPTKDRDPYQPARYGAARWAPVLVAWSDEAAYPGLAGYVAGLGEPQAVDAANGRLVYVSGEVVLDDQQLSTAGLPDRGIASAIVLHELGHLAGLDHTSDRSQIMYSESQFNVRTYGDGDLRGLALLGRQACFPGV